MNNLGLEEPISSTETKMATRAGRDSPTEKRKSNDIDRASLPIFLQRRWWFFSFGFPMIAGTFGPLANLLSVCALVQDWRVYIPPGATETEGEVEIPDPSWLLALNGLSLASAVIANAFLLLNFAKRVPYRIAAPLTVILWYLSAILLLVPICLTPILIIQPRTTHAFSQSYYYGMISCILYLIISTMLLCNALGAYYFRAYPPTFSTLTIPQRTLMLQTIAYTFYLASGAGVFSTVEGWEYLDALYWADYTLLTIGLGSDFPLETSLGRALLIPFAVGGITMIGLVVGSVRDLVLERAVIRMEKARLVKERQRWGRTDSMSSGTREEFDIMRKVERRASVGRRYSALAISFSSFLIIWTMGALGFWFAEKRQGWTYFESLYFSYTTLLTIGYGDFCPDSNSGKPFFVIWTLIAVPTMTILVSNLGDTLVEWVKHGTIWVSRYTVLPEKMEAPTDDEMPFDEIFEKTHRALQLTRAINRVMGDMNDAPPKRYGWDEWQALMSLCEDGAMDRVWLADDGPLFSDMNEANWLVTRLCQELEQLLEQELYSSSDPTPS
ncbi:voltage-gated potassium channel [Hymenopellis radicata]|nr:voltage-gated potassium channel [Hymenopellis radicata]